MRGVLSATRAAASHNRDSFIATQRNEAALVCKAVDGVHDEVIASIEQCLSVGFGEEFRQRAHVTLGIDAADAFGHDFDFDSANIRVERMKLTIHIADADLVEIDEREVADARACERFDSPRSHAANTDHANMGGTQTRERIHAEKPANATKSKFEVTHPRAIYNCPEQLRHSQPHGLWYNHGVQAMFKLLLPALALFAMSAQAQVPVPGSKNNSPRMETKSSGPVAGATTNAAAKREVATLAGGCFWGMEEILRKIPGVLDTKVGYTGGSVPNPTYKLVCTGITGHAEALEIGFDPSKISYEDILLTFFRMHDPTTLNQQHNDRGTQYRSAIFYHTDEQKQIAERVKARVDKSGKWKKPVVTEITKATQFYVAEDYHQKYLIKNPGGYNCHALLDMKF